MFLETERDGRPFILARCPASICSCISRSLALIEILKDGCHNARSERVVFHLGSLEHQVYQKLGLKYMAIWLRFG